MLGIIMLDHAIDCLAAITGERSLCNCPEPKKPEQVWCSRCGEPYPGPYSPDVPYYSGDGALWAHLGILGGLVHRCDSGYNNATNQPPTTEFS